MKTRATTMRWASHMARSETLQAALEEAVPAALQGLEGPPDLILVFVASLFRNHYHQVPKLMAELCPPEALLVGCSGGGIIGGGHEAEAEPAVSILAARLPGVTLHPFALDGETMPDLDGPPDAWHEWLQVPPGDPKAFILLPDPFSCDVENLLRGMDYAWPRAVKVGGLASGAQHADGNALFLRDSHQTQGLVGVALSGAIAVDTIVAQGCRPVGRPMVITECHRNVLLAVDGRPPAVVLQELVASVDERDRELMRTSLFLGLVMDPSRNEPRQGDFLVRNILGLDPTRGCLFVGAALRPGQLVQFHLRDARTSADDLRTLIAHYQQSAAPPPVAALLFSCLGRGRYLYGEPDHDTAMFLQQVGPVPIGGFFCNGEIGPVGGTAYVHGYTSSFALIRPAG